MKRINFKRLKNLLVLAIVLSIPCLMMGNNEPIVSQKKLLKEVLIQFEDRYKVLFSYEQSLVKDIEVNFKFKGKEKFEPALKRLLKSVQLNYDTYGDKYIVIYKQSEEAAKDLSLILEHFKEIEEIESKGRLRVLRKGKGNSNLTDVKDELATFENVSGRVTDDNGNPLLGATITIKGTNTGVVTDINGNFSIEVNSFPATLIVSYVGFNAKTIVIESAQTDLNIVLVEGLTLDEIIVTSRKREESLKDVPVSVTAVSGRKLASLDAQDITATADLAPNVNFSYGGTSSGSSSAAVVYIRGVGQNDFVPTVDPGVGIYVDGVYLGRTVGAILDLVDVNRVEVLRGPQGTLFGRNTIGGAISLTSNEPKDELSGSISATGGSFSRTDVAGTIHLPVSEKFKTSLSFVSKNRDGYVERLLVGDDLGDENVFGIKANLLYKPTDKLKFKLSFDYSRERENSAAEEQLNAEGVFPDIVNGAILNDPDCLTEECVRNSASNIPFTTNETGPSQNDNDAYGISLVGDFKLSENLSIKSITAYRDLDAEFARSSDGTAFDIFSTEDIFEQSQFSQELQLLGSYDKIDFATGLYYFNEDAFNQVDARADILSEPGIVPVFPFDIGGTVDNSNFAVFGEATYNITEKLHLTGGLRFSDETKRFDPFAINGLGNENVTPGERELNFSEVTWRGIFAYDVTESINSYFSVSRGFKSGGFDIRFTNPTIDLEPTSFSPETVLSYEAGFKSYFKDAGLRVNFSAFISDYENIQVSINPPGGVATRTVNGAQANIKGIELDFDWAVTKNLIIDGTLGLLDGEYTELAQDSELSLDDELIRTPTSSYSLGVSYRIGLKKAGAIIPNITLASQNDIHFEPVNNDFVFEDGYTAVNFITTYTTANNKFSLSGGVINLTDERYLIAGDSNDTIGYALGIFARPRNYFLTAKYNF